MTEEEMAQLILRRFVWDLNHCSHVPEALVQMGMVPGSTDVLDREHAERHMRDVLLYPIEERVSMLCGLAANVLTTTILTGQVTEEDLLDDLPYLLEASTRAVLSYLLSCRVIHI